MTITLTQPDATVDTETSLSTTRAHSGHALDRKAILLCWYSGSEAPASQVPGSVRCGFCGQYENVAAGRFQAHMMAL